MVIGLATFPAARAGFFRESGEVALVDQPKPLAELAGHQPAARAIARDDRRGHAQLVSGLGGGVACTDHTSSLPVHDRIRNCKSGIASKACGGLRPVTYARRREIGARIPLTLNRAEFFRSKCGEGLRYSLIWISKGSSALRHSGERNKAGWISRQVLCNF